MAAMYREVVLKEKPIVAENGFIPLGALTNPNGGIAPRAESGSSGAGGWGLALGYRLSLSALSKI